MSATSLNLRLDSLFDSLKQTELLITRLSKSTPQAKTASPNQEDGDARIELTADIHQSLKEQEEDFELLRQEAEDQTSTIGWVSASRPRGNEKEQDRTDVAAQINRLGEELKI